MVKTVGTISVAAGVLLVIAGLVTWFVVSDTLAAQNITTASDACLPDRPVSGPFTAFCQADVINKHTLDITGGLTYAELPQDDPLRETAMQSAFLQSSLFTSVVAFGVAAMAAGMGIIVLLIGMALRRLEPAEQQPEA